MLDSFVQATNTDACFVSQTQTNQKKASSFIAQERKIKYGRGRDFASQKMKAGTYRKMFLRK
jgi:hypothetical protein